MTRFETVVFDHLKRFAFREDLPAPAWTREAAEAAAPASPRTSGTETGRTANRRGRVAVKRAVALP